MKQLWRVVTIGLAVLGLLVSCGESETVDGQAEAAQRRIEPGGAEMIDDMEAEGGQAARLLREGDAASFSLEGVPEACYEMEVRVRADLYKGAPTLRLSVNGQQREGATIETPTYEDLSFGSACLAGGRIDAELTDDRYDGAGRDRNLYIDHLTLTPDAEPTAPPDGGLKDAAGPGTLIGAVGRQVDIGRGGAFPTENYRELYPREFDLATVLGYPKSVWKGPQEFDLADYNAAVNWFEGADMKQMSHLLVGPVQYYPDWFSDAAEKARADGDAAQLERYMETFISGVMTSNDNGRKVEYWNVVNEPFWYPGAKERYYVGTWWNALGTEPDRSGLEGDAKLVDAHPVWIRRAFEIADKYTDGKLELRERRVSFSNGEYGDHYDVFYQLAAHLVKSGVPVDAVGLQARANTGVDFDWESFTAQIKRLKALGLEVYLTEVEVKNDGTEAGLQRQRDVLYQYTKAARAGGVDIINFWGVVDGQVGQEGNGVLFKGNPESGTLDPKPAYDGFKQALEETY